MDGEMIMTLECLGLVSFIKVPILAVPQAH